LFNQGRGDFRRRIFAIAQKFKDSGATSPEHAMSAQELGLPPRFEEAMKRRLGQTGIFVEVSGKYYLNEAKLGQMGRSGFGGGARMQRDKNVRTNMMTLRMIRLIVGVAVLLLIVANIFFMRNPEVWIVVGVLLIITIATSILQIYYVSRARSMRNFGTPP
jgi:hypothetical protein